MQDISFEIAKYCDVKRLKVLRQVKPFFVAATRLVTFRYGYTTISTKEARRVAFYHDYEYFKTYFDNITHLVIKRITNVNPQEIIKRINSNAVTSIDEPNTIFNLHIFPNLREIKYRYCSIEYVEDIPILIEKLHLLDARIIDSIILDNVRELILDNSDIPYSMFRYIGKTARKLALFGTMDYAFIIKYFANLTDLRIQILQNTMDMENALTHLKKLRKLTLVDNKYRGKNFKNLINSAPNLKYLDYSGCDISGTNVPKTRNLSL